MPEKTTNQKTAARVDVRMYNHGLGDCFLLAIHGEDNKKVFMLIDCGLHGLQANKRELFEKVLKDIKEQTKGKDGKSVLDIVVGTHQHYDHLSGFHIVGKNGKAFNDISIKELWLAWTENEDDAEAKNFQLAQQKKEQAMRVALGKIEQAGFDAGYAEQFKYLLGFVYDFEGESSGSGQASLAATEDMLGASGENSNVEALNFLREKVKKESGKIRYMEPPASGFPGREPGNKPIDIGIEGVRIYVLGPPKQNAEEYLGSMNPRQGEGFGDHQGVANLFPEEAAFLNALGIDTQISSDSLAGSKKDYPFSKNYKVFHNPFTNNYLLSGRLQQVLKNNMGHLLRKLLCSQVERLSKAPFGEGILEALQEDESAGKLKYAAINGGLDQLLLMKVKKAIKNILKKKPAYCQVEDYEPQKLKTPSLDDAALDEIFEKQLQNYLIGLAPWAADTLQTTNQNDLTFEDVLKALLTDWIKAAVKKLTGAILIDFQNQQESLIHALKQIIFKMPEDEEEQADFLEREKLFPTDEDKNNYISFSVKKKLSEIIQENPETLNRFIFQPGIKYISSIQVRKRFKEVIKGGEYDIRWAGYDKIALLLTGAILQGLDLKLKELGQELKNRKKEKASDASEANFLSGQDKAMLLGFLRQGIPTDLLEGLSPLDRIVMEYGNTFNQWRNIDQDWLKAAESMALKLDSVRNNTSLVLAIELVKSNKVLLFPGDAQAGNWRSWAEVEYTVGDKKVKAKELLEKTVFYKVGHHGSHNATLNKQGLDLMKKDELAAMIPVDQHVADKVGWEMPFAPLLEALLEKTNGKVAIADAKMDISRLLDHLPEEQRTATLKKHLEELKVKWEKAGSAFTPSTKKLTFSYKEKGAKKTFKEERPLYFEYRVG